MSFWLESISLGLPCIQPAELQSLCVFPGLLWGYRVSHGVPQAGTPCLRLEAQQQTEPVDHRKLLMSLLHPTTSTRWDVSSSSDAPLQYMVAGREHQLTQWSLDVISVLGENATFTRFPGLINFSLFFSLWLSQAVGDALNGLWNSGHCLFSTLISADDRLRAAAYLDMCQALLICWNDGHRCLLEFLIISRTSTTRYLDFWHLSAAFLSLCQTVWHRDEKESHFNLQYEPVRWCILCLVLTLATCIVIVIGMRVAMLIVIGDIGWDWAKVNESF